jgi:putative flippase GtrA
VASLVDRARRYAHTDQFAKLWRYASVSVITTIFTNTLLFVFYDVISLGTAMECNVVATTITTVPSYYLNRSWTWRKSGKSHVWREVVPFWVIAFLSLVLSTIAVGVAAHNADRVSHAKIVRSLLVVGANIVTYGSIWVFKFFLYNRYLFQHQPVEPPVDELATAGVPAAGVAADGMSQGLAAEVPAASSGR